jgi:hypothetical protein
LIDSGSIMTAYSSPRGGVATHQKWKTPGPQPFSTGGPATTSPVSRIRPRTPRQALTPLLGQSRSSAIEQPVPYRTSVLPW